MDVAEPIKDCQIITGEQLWAMGDIGPCELIDGRVIRMSPTGGEHGWLETKLIGQLLAFVSEKDLGWVLGGEVGIYTQRDPDRVRGADVVFISKRRSPKRPQKGFLDISPDLVIEIVSPSDRWVEVHQKIEEYLDIGVHRVWIVNPENRNVRVYRSSTKVQNLTDGDIVEGEGSLVGFKQDISSLFNE